MQWRHWVWGAALSGVAVVAAAGAVAQDALDRMPQWPQPAPARKNVLTRVRFPERPVAELDDSPAAIRQLLKELNSDDANRSSDAFGRLFWIGAPARAALEPIVEAARRSPEQATRADSRAFKTLYALRRFDFYRPVRTPLKLRAPVVTATPQSMHGRRWPHGLTGKPKAVTLEVNTRRHVTYGLNYRGMELILVNRSGATIEIPRAGMRLDCIAEAETKEGWVAIETPPALDRRAPKVWKLKHDHAAESAVPCYTGSLATRLRYRLTLRGAKEPVYSNIFDAQISPAQLTGKPGRLEHDHTPR